MYIYIILYTSTHITHDADENAANRFGYIQPRELS